MSHMTIEELTRFVNWLALSEPVSFLLFYGWWPELRVARVFDDVC